MSRRTRVELELTRVSPLYGWFPGAIPQHASVTPEDEARCLTYVANHEWRLVEMVNSGAFNFVIAVHENPVQPQYFLARLAFRVRIARACRAANQGTL